MCEKDGRGRVVLMSTNDQTSAARPLLCLPGDPSRPHLPEGPISYQTANFSSFLLTRH